MKKVPVTDIVSYEKSEMEASEVRERAAHEMMAANIYELSGEGLPVEAPVHIERANESGGHVANAMTESNSHLYEENS
jgi:hypothetical protein